MKSRQWYVRVAKVLVLIMMLAVWGCGDDITDPSSSGTITIHQTPDSLIGAGWLLTGPQAETGSRDTTFTDMPVGDYILTWDDVSGYMTPSDTTQTLTDGGTISFNGTYAIETGTITIHQTPNSLTGAGWSLSGPQTESGSGDQTLTDMPVGDYAISWDSIYGWTSPAVTSGSLAQGDTLSFEGQYQECYPFPGTPDQLMQNFKSIYENMDIDVYRNLLHPDYLTILKASTIRDFPEVGPTLDYTEEVRIQTHMFSGAPGHDAQGYLQNSISSIAFQDPVQLTSWELSPSDDPVPNTLSALFDVLFEFNRAGDTTLRVTGQIKFYITSRDSLYQGANKPYYQMIGQWDLTNDVKANENASFGWVKALFR